MFPSLQEEHRAWICSPRATLYCPRDKKKPQISCSTLDWFYILKFLSTIRHQWLRSCRNRHQLCHSQGTIQILMQPPYLSWLWSKFWPKNYVSLKVGINSNSFGPFSEFFFQKLQKSWRKLKTYQKLLKNERKFQIW